VLEFELVVLGGQGCSDAAAAQGRLFRRLLIAREHADVCLLGAQHIAVFTGRFPCYGASKHLDIFHHRSRSSLSSMDHGSAFPLAFAIPVWPSLFAPLLPASAFCFYFLPDAAVSRDASALILDRRLMLPLTATMMIHSFFPEMCTPARLKHFLCCSPQLDEMPNVRE